MPDVPRVAHSMGFLGAGQMATALAKGWLSAGLLDPTTSLASDPFPAAREKFFSATGMRTVESNLAVQQKCDVIILAVKPQMMSAVLRELHADWSDRHLIISIAAGVSLKQLGELVSPQARLVRVMPNTPCLIGLSATGITPGGTTSELDKKLVCELFDAVGKSFLLPEHLLDAVTGLSGSGPAYIYVLIEALADGGVRVGLPRDVALALATQTVLGSARMVLETGQHPGVLKDAVASPGGTTIAGLHALERAGFRAALMDAVEAATRRSTELGAK